MLLTLTPNSYSVFVTKYRCVASFEDIQNAGYVGTKGEFVKLTQRLQKLGYLGGVALNTSDQDDMYLFIVDTAWDAEWESYTNLFDALAPYTDLLSVAEIADEQHVWRCGGHKTSNNGTVEAI